MKNYTIQFYSCLLLILFTGYMPTSAIAQEIGFIPRAWLGVADYHYKQDPRKGALNGMDFPEVEFDVTFIMVGMGLTSTYDRFYLDLSYQDSSEEEDSFSSGGFYEKFEGDRRDYSSTLGMRILNNRGNVYMGYKNGKTSGRGHLGTDLVFREKGLFIGASYGWLIADQGFLAINAAYADLDGHLKETPGPSYPKGLGMNADSETTGLSYGMSWTGVITPKLGYSLAMDVNNYEFDNLKDSSSNVPLPDKIEESLYTGKVSIFYRF